MKLLRAEMDGEVFCGILDDERILRLPGADLHAYLSMPTCELPAPRATLPRDHVRTLPPLIPGKILAIGRNYAEHAAELENEVPAEPLVFAVMPSAVIGEGDSIVWDPSLTTQVDYEGELAVVIGRRASKVAELDALEFVFGYTIANDVSARDLQTRDKQWTRAKGMDTFCPLGPVIVTRDAIPDPQKLRITTTVDGTVRQDGSTADMIFNVAQLIAYLSRAFTLNPGDIILTGTPSGVGKAQNPPQFLCDGSTVSVAIAGIGKLTNRCRVL